jgi:hypothetical protein
MIPRIDRGPLAGIVLGTLIGLAIWALCWVLGCS